MLAQIARMLLQLGSVMVLARILSPYDYGLMTLALTVVILGEVFRDFGLSTAAIQAPTISRGQQSNLLWINVALGLTLAVVALIGAPLLRVVGPYGGAVGLLQVMSATFVINGLMAQYRADLSRRLRFGAIAGSDLAGQTVGVTLAVATALGGAGVWALAIQQIAAVTITAVMIIAFAGWLPRAPDRGSDVRPMLRFGVGMVGTQMLGYINNNIDTYTVAWRFGPVSLGTYSRAFQVLMQPLNQTLVPTSTVAVPLLSRLEPGGEAAARLLVRGQAALGYTVVAVTAFAFGAATPIVALALGPTWQDATPLFAALACAGALQALGYVSYWTFVSRGLSAWLFRYSLVSVLIRAICVLIGSAGGVLGAAIGYAAATAIQMPLGVFMLHRRTPIPARALLTGAARALSAAMVVGLVTFAIQRMSATMPSLAQLAVCAAGTLGVYLVLAVIVPPVRRDLRGVAQFARMVLRRS